MERCEKATKSVTLFNSYRGVQYPKICFIAGCDQTEVTQKVCVDNDSIIPVTDEQMAVAVQQWRRITHLEDNNFIPYRFQTYTYFLNTAGVLSRPDISVWK